MTGVHFQGFINGIEEIMKNHRLISKSELITRSGLSENEFNKVEKARLIVSEDTENQLFREKHISWCEKMSNLLDWEWSVEEIKFWAKNRWIENKGRQWPPDYQYWKSKCQKMAENEAISEKPLEK
jgi:hypothetical protein